MYDVLVVGSANVDLTVRVARRPGAGETVIGGELVESPGGKGANQAVAAARLGARVALLARIGDDAHGALVLDAQRSAGVEVSQVRVGGARTGCALITVGPDGDNSIVVAPGANAALSPADVDSAPAASVVCLQLEIPLETVRAAAAAASAAGARVVLNPSPVPDRLPASLLAQADPLVVNEHEARLLSGLAAGTPEAWARALRALGARSVVVTLGAAGALVLDGGRAETVPGVAVRAIDTTGAGDAFTGALAWRLARGDSLADAVRLAVRVGAAAVTRLGAQTSYPTADRLPPA